MSDQACALDGISNDEHNRFDIIEGLQKRFLQDVLHIIFGYLDEESFVRAEFVSSAWKAAVSDGYPGKLWDKWLKKKITTSPLWERLHYCLAPNFKIAPSNHLYSKKVFSMLQYTIESLEKNWQNCTFTRDYIICDDGRTQSMFQIRNKFIAKLEIINNRFKIWNRQTLKLEEVYQVGQTNPQYPFFGVLPIDYELYEHALIHSLAGQTICIRNLTTKKNDVYKPFGEDRSKRITYLRAENGFLAVVIGQMIPTNENETLAIWKMNSPTEVDWDSVQIISPMIISNSRLFMDERFLIILTHHSSSYSCDARKMSEPGKKGKIIKIPKTRPEILYSEGYLITVNMRNNIVLVDVKSGVSKTVIRTSIDFSQRSTFMRMHSGLIVVCSSVGSKHLPSKINVWNFNEAKESTGGVSLQPMYSYEAFVDPANVFHFDYFGIVGVGHREKEPCHSVIQVIDFLPVCNSCKQIRKNLLLCGRCKSARYCGPTCQKTDWLHHKEQCREVKLRSG